MVKGCAVLSTGHLQSPAAHSAEELEDAYKLGKNRATWATLKDVSAKSGCAGEGRCATVPALAGTM